MSDLKLDDTNWDLVVENSDLAIVDRQDAVKENIKQRLRLFLGEWFLDTASGIPYYQDVLKKNPNPVIVQGVFQDAIINTPGVLELLDFQLNYSRSARTLEITFSVRTTTGQIDFTEVVEV